MGAGVTGTDCLRVDPSVALVVSGFGRTVFATCLHVTDVAVTWAKRQHVARSQRSTLKTTHGARQMRSATPEYSRHIDSPGDGEIRARTSEPPATLQARAGPQRHCGVHRHGPVIDRQLELRTTHRHHPFVVALQLGSDQRRFECGVFGGVSDERIREAMCVRVHGSGNGHAA